MLKTDTKTDTIRTLGEIKEGSCDDDDDDDRRQKEEDRRRQQECGWRR